ncbi:MAG: hypothetical protein ACREI3_12550 [Nitrospirales bacterium]
MKHPACFFRTISLVTVLSLILVLLPVTTGTEALARMTPPWNTSSVPQADSCVPPAMLHAAWRNAVTIAARQAKTDPSAARIVRQLNQAQAAGTLPFATTAPCPLMVVDPLTVAAVIGLASLTIMLLIWALSVIGSTG